MALRIEDYALIGDTQTAALVGIDGSIDWLCVPRFDSAACFASLLGTEENGSWIIGPAEGGRRLVQAISRRHPRVRDQFETGDRRRRASSTSCRPGRRFRGSSASSRGCEGPWTCRARFVPGSTTGRPVPGCAARAATSRPGRSGSVGASRRRAHGAQRSGYDRVHRRCGDRVGFVLTSYSSWEDPPPPTDASEALDETDAWWREWSGRSTYRGGWADEVERSLITLKALTYEPTGGVVAAATTSLPEFLGGVRNWDYRFCWLRDAALTLDALMAAGYVDEATRVARLGRPSGRRRSRGPADHVRRRRRAEARGVRTRLVVGIRGVDAGPRRQRGIGAAAARRVRGTRRRDLPCAPAGDGAVAGRDRAAPGIVDWLEEHWHDPDDGVWEVRGPRRNFVHSKVMAWVAADRIVKMAEESGIRSRSTA